MTPAPRIDDLNIVWQYCGVLPNKIPFRFDHPPSSTHIQEIKNPNLSVGVRFTLTIKTICDNRKLK